VRCRPIGALMMEDEAGPDEKIIAVPWINWRRSTAVCSHIRICRRSVRPIAHFFQHYKDLKRGKWVNTYAGWVLDGAAELIAAAIARAPG